MIFLGIGSAIIKLTLLTNISLITKEKRYGQVFGMYLIFANIGVALGTLGIGHILDLDS